MGTPGEGGGPAPLWEEQGGGGGGGDPKQRIIEQVRKALLDALLNDPDCISFLGRYWANVVGTLKNVPITHEYVTGVDAHAAAVTRNDGNFHGIGDNVPTNPSIAINDKGFFFTRPDNLPFQGPVLLHELGHATGALVPDGQQNDAERAKNQAINSEALKLNCAKTLAALGKK